jgi:hypothetical protein
MNPIRKGLVVAVIVLLVGISFTSTGRLMSDEDTTPPVTTIDLEPPFPDGENDWYVHDVEVFLEATDDLSGVKAIYYRFDGEDWLKNKTGEPYVYFEIAFDGIIQIEYYSIDNAGNEEEIKSTEINMDQTVPKMKVVDIRMYKQKKQWIIEFYPYAIDETSGMDRVEFYIDGELIELKNGSGPKYNFTFVWSGEHIHSIFEFYHYDKAGWWIDDTVYNIHPTQTSYSGLIYNPIIKENNVSFYSILTIEHFWTSGYPVRRIIMFKHFVYPNDYHGYIGRNIILATFHT